MLSFGLKDAIDITLFAILLYYIWRLMKKSSAANIFTGIIIFVIAWIMVSRIFELRLLGGFMDNLMNIGLLALVVLFQDEIRHFFSTIGSDRGMKALRHIFKKRSGEAIHRTEIMPLVMACMNMSKQKVGALIVIERGVGLQEYIATGETFNADINQRLIENLFFKNSPMHDGGVIISHGKIVAAGCILPVSHDQNIPKSLGLRHRAALGISQKTDCISICVSEETGGISVAMNNDFKLRLTAEELERLLNKEWTVK